MMRETQQQLWKTLDEAENSKEIDLLNATDIDLTVEPSSPKKKRKQEEEEVEEEEEA